jgi:hypothetical protein
MRCLGLFHTGGILKDGILAAMHVISFLPRVVRATQIIYDDSRCGGRDRVNTVKGKDLYVGESRLHKSGASSDSDGSYLNTPSAQLVDNNSGSNSALTVGDTFTFTITGGPPFSLVHVAETTTVPGITVPVIGEPRVAIRTKSSTGSRITARLAPS